MPPLTVDASIKMKIRGADFVLYQVSNLARAARIYREILGLPQEMYNKVKQSEGGVPRSPDFIHRWRRGA